MNKNKKHLPPTTRPDSGFNDFDDDRDGNNDGDDDDDAPLDYIRIPSDLFGERGSRRRIPNHWLPMPSVGRTAGVYPAPRRVIIPDPWAARSDRWASSQAGFLQDSLPPATVRSRRMRTKWKKKKKKRGSSTTVLGHCIASPQSPNWASAAEGFCAKPRVCVPAVSEKSTTTTARRRCEDSLAAYSLRYYYPGSLRCRQTPLQLAATTTAAVKGLPENPCSDALAQRRRSRDVRHFRNNVALDRDQLLCCPQPGGGGGSEFWRVLSPSVPDSAPPPPPTPRCTWLLEVEGDSDIISRPFLRHSVRNDDPALLNATLQKSYPRLCQETLANRTMQAGEGRQDEQLLPSNSGQGADGDHVVDLDGLIELVAQTNQAVPVQTLPEVRASPCAMHSRRNRHDLDLLYATNCHGGKVGPPRLKHGCEGEGAGFLPEHKHEQGQRRVCHIMGEGLVLAPAGRILQDVPPRHSSTRPGREELSPIKEAREINKSRFGGAGQNPASSGNGSRTLLKPRLGKDAAAAKDGPWDSESCSPRQQQLLQQNLQHQKLYQQQQRFQRRVSPAELPGELPSQDVVLSWLKHGSVTPTKKQFPEIRRGAEAYTECEREDTKEVF